MEKLKHSCFMAALAVLTIGFVFTACEDALNGPVEPVKSSDAVLSGLTINGISVADMGNPAALDNETELVSGTVEIPTSGKDAITVMAASASNKASYQYAKSVDGTLPSSWLDTAPVDFEDGEYLFILVTAEDRKTRLVYSIKIELAANIATLENITIGGRAVDSMGDPASTIDGISSAGILKLLPAELVALGSSIAVTVTKTDPEAAVRYAKTNGAQPDSESFGLSASFSLAFNDIIWLEITSADETVVLYYKIEIKEHTGSTPDGWEYTSEWAANFKAALPAPSYYNTNGENWEWPDLYKFWDGTPVLTKLDWKKRYEEIKIILQHYLYGYIPPAPTYTSITYNTSARTITIAMSYEGNTASVTTGAITWPSNTALYPAETGMPLSFGGNAANDGTKGYALMGVPSGGTWNTAISNLYANKMAADDYPGDLIRTAWGLERIIDAIEYLNTQEGMGGMQNRIDPAKTTITGHSRGGKDAIVGAAFSRVSVAAPSSSGAFGLAPERWIRAMVLPTNNAKLDFRYEGKGYWYLSVARGSGSNANATPKVGWILPVLGDPSSAPPEFAVKYGPIQSIQNYDHARYDGTAGGNFNNGTLSTWPGARIGQFSSFNQDKFYTSENGFQDKGSMAQAPFDQHYLAALMATPDNPRALIMTAGGDGDSWVNPEGMYMIFLVTRQLYKWLGDFDGQNYVDRVAAFVDTPNGHTHTTFRRRQQVNLCEYMWKGTPLPTDTITGNTGFLQQGENDGHAAGTGFEGLTGLNSPYPWDIRSLPDYELITTAPYAQKSIAQIAKEYLQTHTTY
jgi:hypothetical protein